MSLREHLVARIEALPSGVSATLIQMTAEDWARLAAEAELETAAIDPALVRQKTFQGVPVELVEHGGPHVHYSSPGHGDPREA